MMTANLDVIETEADELETCDECGCLTESTDGGMCPACAEAEAAKQDAITTAEAELEDADSELSSLADELVELQARIAEAKARKRSAARELARLTK